ncbi:MAG: kynurenine 3-monooxygenase, mitochondrial precursor [Vezdaea aestivalis]|nr:MAG: kynurenine 3-monooxygenase, mitochondrial precursor [Vezdaea aestivalis]
MLMADQVSNNGQKTVIVGAGPVGSLAAIYAARRGDQVQVYELRQEIRAESIDSPNFTKSINLALSERGINSIRQSQNEALLATVLEGAIPMHGRMIHTRKPDGTTLEQAQPYDAHGRYIRAIDRAQLNKCLLDELKRFPNVALYFGHKLTGANFDTNIAWFEKKGSSAEGSRDLEIEVEFDFLIGADGAHSATRYHLMKYVRMEYHQEYIDALWCEFGIPPTDTSDGGFRISENHLHIWPAGDSMFIAIANPNKSFTCTLFLPASEFRSLESKNNQQALVSFFHQKFPGVVSDLIKPEDLFAQFQRNQHLPLINIKCAPHSYASSCVILGDAAHAMVPFYGQGMNAGMEDVRVLYELLDQHSTTPQASTSDRTFARRLALDAYSAKRIPDAFAINDLALQNYEEMRSSVKSPLYLARKHLEELISVYLPSLRWRTQYARVSFENERYSEVAIAVEKQGRILFGLSGVVAIGVVSVLIGGFSRWRGINNNQLLTKWLGHLVHRGQR